MSPTPESTKPARFVFRLADGSSVEGQVQGNGGPIPRHVAVSRARLMLRRARSRRPLFEYEPKPGHVRCCDHGNASCHDAEGAGCHDIDLRTATLESIDGAPFTEA